jgi:hypothetical protein
MFSVREEHFGGGQTRGARLARTDDAMVRQSRSKQDAKARNALIA